MRLHGVVAIAFIGLVCAWDAAEAQLLRRENFTLSTGFELGRHRTPVSWMESNRTAVRTFGRWEPLGQLTLRIRPWGENEERGG